MMPRDENVTSADDAGQNSRDTDEAEAPNFRGLKILVIALGIAIVGMLALIVYTISQRAAAGLLGEGNDAATPVQVEETVQPVLAGTFDLQRPVGAELVSVRAAGSELIFHFRSGDGDTVIVLNRKTGQQSTVVVPAP